MAAKWKNVEYKGQGMMLWPTVASALEEFAATKYEAAHKSGESIRPIKWDMEIFRGFLAKNCVYLEGGMPYREITRRTHAPVVALKQLGEFVGPSSPSKALPLAVLEQLWRARFPNGTEFDPELLARGEADLAQILAREKARLAQKLAPETKKPGSAPHRDVVVTDGTTPMEGPLRKSPEDRAPSHQPGYEQPSRKDKVIIKTYISEDVREDFRRVAKAAGVTAETLLAQLVLTAVEQKNEPGFISDLVEESERRTKATKTLLRKLGTRVLQKRR